MSRNHFSSHVSRLTSHVSHFPKRERLVSRKLIDMLFEKTAGRTLAAFPLRLVYHVRQRSEGDQPVQMLVSVPKRCFHHAVDRNRVKRQVREAYRVRKHRLAAALPADKSLMLAFVWLSDRHLPTADVAARVEKLLDRLTSHVS